MLPNKVVLIQFQGFTNHFGTDVQMGERWPRENAEPEGPTRPHHSSQQNANGLTQYPIVNSKRHQAIARELPKVNPFSGTPAEMESQRSEHS